MTYEYINFEEVHVLTCFGLYQTSVYFPSVESQSVIFACVIVLCSVGIRSGTLKMHLLLSDQQYRQNRDKNHNYFLYARELTVLAFNLI